MKGVDDGGREAAEERTSPRLPRNRSPLPSATRGPCPPLVHAVRTSSQPAGAWRASTGSEQHAHRGPPRLSDPTRVD